MTDIQKQIAEQQARVVEYSDYLEQLAAKYNKRGNFFLQGVWVFAIIGLFTDGHVYTMFSIGVVVLFACQLICIGCQFYYGRKSVMVLKEFNDYLAYVNTVMDEEIKSVKKMLEIDDEK